MMRQVVIVTTLALAGGCSPNTYDFAIGFADGGPDGGAAGYMRAGELAVLDIGRLNRGSHSALDAVCVDLTASDGTLTCPGLYCTPQGLVDGGDGFEARRVVLELPTGPVRHDAYPLYRAPNVAETVYLTGDAYSGSCAETLGQQATETSAHSLRLTILAADDMAAQPAPTDMAGTPVDDAAPAGFRLELP